ncbi:hypothetical protein HMPREF3104_03600 [Corynebacterium sp. HMSC30G07]|uniref:P27 family phage terminase small subunit n=1 Tax=Corynebacterium sp. HMSC30G07 TaxID=1581072 RepID=UPI0008A5E1DB|nr:P27 family phage terminase small subunit [Corynebacterium sp. HMSC30G07]OFT77002.1 hypothetical protein HMPREF3104_03600 [Corynebacterium sp. HMSC30G07]
MTVLVPENLGPAGLRLWDSMVGEFDFQGEPGKVAILERACRVADQIEKLEEASATAPLTAKGSTGQLIIHPLIQEIRAQTTTLNTLIKSLGLPDSDAEAVERAQRRERQARRAANARWSRGGGK